MLFYAALAGAFATAALANPVKRAADQLTIKVTGPSSGAVDSVDQLKFTAEITNNGAEAVKVLKYGTVLDSLPTRSFTVTQNGTTVPFVGAKVGDAVLHQPLLHFHAQQHPVSCYPAFRRSEQR